MRPGQARARSETDTEKQLPQVATVISQPPSMNSRATMPVVPALPSKNLPPTEPLPPVATVVMPPDGKSGRETPTPRLLEKLLMHVQDAPVELASPLRWWHKVPLLHAVVEFFKRLFGKA
jgi:hypothetical protein